MKKAIKRENDEFCSELSNVYRVFIGHANYLGTRKLWQSLKKTAIKFENDEFLVMSLKHVFGFMGRANRWKNQTMGNSP